MQRRVRALLKGADTRTLTVGQIADTLDADLLDVAGALVDLRSLDLRPKTLHAVASPVSATVPDA